MKCGELEGSDLGDSETEVGSSGDMPGGEIEGAELEESGTEAGSYGERSGGNGDSKVEVYPLGEKLFVSEFRTKVGNYIGISDG